MKVLVVEGSQLFRQMLGALFARNGMDVAIVKDENAAKAQFKSGKFQLICLSMQLPGTTGLELAKVARASQNTAKTPILLLTAEPNEGLLKEAIEVGVSKVIAKTNMQEFSENIGRFAKSLSPLDFNGRKVLYVEDSRAVAAMTMAVLENMGLETTHFTTAEEAWATFQDEDFDLVITDIVLEGKMNGIDLVLNIRGEDLPKGGLPVLAVTGHDDAARRLGLYRAGVSDYVTKPIVNEEFTARLNNLISNKLMMDKIHDQQAMLTELAMRDNLTGLHNRNSMSEFASKAVVEAARHHYHLCMLVFDLDFFKRVNDDHGHATGDQVLAEFGQLLQGCFRESDFVARFGGEEFIAILPHCDLAEGLAKAERVRAEQDAARPAGLHVTLSIGVADLRVPDRSDFDTLFRCADEAVYLAKETGRNRVCKFEAENSTVQEAGVG